MFKWLWIIFSLGALTPGEFFQKQESCFNRACKKFWKLERKNMEMICFLLAVQSALLFNMIILSKGVKGFLIKQKAIDKQIIFLKCNSTANSHRSSYKCEEDHHSNYGRNFGSCEKKHKIFREWNLSRELCDADNQLFSQEPTGRGATIVFTCFIYFRGSDSCLQPTTLWGRNTIFRFSGRFSIRKQ